MQLDVVNENARTEVGSYFVANYPPFSAWTPEHVPAAAAALETPVESRIHRDGGRPTPLGLYLHIPFCRKRCQFCYFRVYTDKNSAEVDEYMQALARETALYAERLGLKGRDFEFVYFGGGTPSFLSSEQLERLIDSINEHWRWEKAREVTFECEPGTLKKGKLKTIKKIGVTRLSLGIEHLDDEVLSLNGRAHKSPEVFRAYAWAREIGFQQINVDLIAGMMGDTEALWKDTVQRTLELQPDSLTVYQMELPHNTVISRRAKETGEPPPIADWKTKREWTAYAFRVFEEAGYVVSSGYTVVKPSESSGFVYRDSVWRGADMIGTGVASFSHFAGVHFQNMDTWEEYVGRLSAGALPIARALPLSDHQRLTRELVLQMKMGRIDAGYFREKFGADVLHLFPLAFDSLVEDEFADVQGEDIRLTREGLLRVDALLPRFFERQYQNVRYT